MSEILKRNFEMGRLLLVVTLLLSMTLISQLYVISESIDLSNGFKLDGIELSLTASYVLTAMSMLIVINEFFQVKTKMKGLLALNQLINQEQNSVTIVIEPIAPIPGLDKLTLEPKLDPVSEEPINNELEFDRLIEDEFNEDKLKNDESKAKYKTTKIRLEEESETLEPLIEEGVLQSPFDTVEEESEMNRLLSQSEVIATLAELEELVEELKHKKVPVIAQ